MTTTHISLVGGQTMPIYMGILELCPDRIIMIHSSSTRDIAEKISKDYNYCNLLEFDPVNYQLVYEKAKVLLESLDGNISINITSGTKPWAIAFSMLSVTYVNTTIIYIDQNCYIYDYTHHIQWESHTKLSTQDILKYNNQDAYQFTPLNEYTKEDFKVLETTKAMRKHNYSDFNTLTMPDKERAKNNCHQTMTQKTLANGSTIFFDKMNDSVSLSLFNRGKGYHIENLVSPHVKKIVYNCGWFELEVALLLSRWKQTKEIWLNTVFPYHNKQAKNEIDIIVNVGNKLLFVECKTQIYDNTDIDKFRTAVKNYGGMGCKALFVTEKNIRVETSEKCHDSGILTFSMNSTGLMPQDKALFLLLESELLNINAK